jgi:CMP-N,N'-diacetyllegionaminic acid synthase
MPRVLALIPARGGSKGVPGKNTRIVAGKPLLVHSIHQALAAETVDVTAVSSDDAAILETAREHGATVLRRPAAMAQDQSPVTEAIAHAYDSCGPFDAVVLLQPTSPLRVPADIDAAVQLFLRTGRPVCSVYRVEDTHPARMYRIENPGVADDLKPLMPNLAFLRRQDLPPVYLRNGALYVFGPDQIAAGRIITDDMVAYVMPPESAVNVDTEMDFALLKLVMEGPDVL